jgi:hypothetical protein
MEDANASLLQRAIYHLQLLQQAAHEAVDGEGLRSTKRHLRQYFGPLAQELFSVVGAVVLAVLIVGFFAVAVPIVVVLQMIESFIQRLGSLLP